MGANKFVIKLNNYPYLFFRHLSLKPKGKKCFITNPIILIFKQK